MTDAGVRLDPDWLSHLLAQLVADDRRRERLLPADPRSRPSSARMGATVLPVARRRRARARSCRRVARCCSDARPGERVGGYPEWLDYCEDLVFDLALQARRRTLRVCPDGHRLVSAARVAASAFFGSTTCTRAATAKPTCGRGATRSATRPTCWRLLVAAAVAGAGRWLLALGGAGCIRAARTRVSTVEPAISTREAA